MAKNKNNNFGKKPGASENKLDPAQNCKDAKAPNQPAPDNKFKASGSNPNRSN